MISLDLRAVRAVGALPDEVRAVSIDSLEQDVNRVIHDMGVLLGRMRDATMVVPSDLLFQALHLLMPPERMGVIAGRRIGERLVLGTTYDVTGRAHRAHVRADAMKLGQALVAFEHAGAALAGWIHSHPGKGPGATTPSTIDRTQYADWVHHYSDRLIGLIVVSDGFIRFWGDAVESGRIRPEIVGTGVEPVMGHRHVYKLNA